MLERCRQLVKGAGDRIRRNWRGLLVFIAVTLCVQALLIAVDAFDSLHALTRSHEDWELDELLMMVLALSCTSFLFMIIYSRRLKSEAVRRAHAEGHLATALNTMHQGLAMFDADQRMVLCNKRYADIHDLPEDLTRPGTPFIEILEARRPFVASDMLAPEDYVRQLTTNLNEAGTYSTLLEQANGRTVSALYVPRHGGGWVSTHEDITERRRAEERIAYMAHHDALTDLPNRILFKEKITDGLKRLDRGDTVAVMCLDLDRFKAVNDALGHPIGDKLLKIVAQRLRTCVREGDHIARFGGDEFAIVQIGSEQPHTATMTVRRLIEALSAPYPIDCHQIVIGVSAGIALAPSDGREAEVLLKNADLALYRAKNDGRGTFHFFEPIMDAKMQARRQLELDLRSALARNEFELFYQPVVNISCNEVIGFEALIRWRHADKGMISPADFIPLAEETGLIVPLGEWVMRQACREAASWPGELKVSVNLSPVQFRSAELVRTVQNALAEASLPARRLELEITEGVLLVETDATLAILNRLHMLGVQIAMDDFGTGYSSLSYFGSFRFDRIKIDRSFIRKIGNDDRALAIIRAVAGLSASLGIATTAEGVETKEQLEQLRAEGYENIQGFFFSAPRPASEIEPFLATARSRGAAA